MTNDKSSVHKIDQALFLNLKRTHKKTMSSGSKKENNNKSELLSFVESGQLPNKCKIKSARVHKKEQYFSSKVNEIHKKKRFQPTPVLTPIISERNSNCPNTIKDMETLNNR